MTNRDTYVRRGLPVAFVFVIVLIALHQVLWVPNMFQGDRTVTVSKGMTFRAIVDSLASRGVIRSRSLFELSGKLLGKTKQMYIGKYLFRPGVSNYRILDDLTTGKSALLISVTVREGLRIRQQARLYKNELGIDSARFAQLAFDSAFARSAGIEANSLEGYLLPETYLFYWQTDEEEIIRRMVGEFQLFYVDSLKLRTRELRMTTNQVVTLASIVEGETSLDSERAIIAGVYYNRLRKPMHLNADPTIQYIIKDGPRRLWQYDLRIQSPYNTYLHYGLPPGPINNPGRASVLAALYPAKNSYLYFVADGKGGHIFSRTYSEHMRAVYRYRRVLSRLSLRLR